MSTNIALAASANRIAGALADYNHLPAPSWLSIDAAGRNHRMNFMQFGNGPYAELRALAAWAVEFDVFINIGLSYSDCGTASIEVELGGEAVKCKASISSAHAYELGRLLGRPLENTAVRISGDALLAALAAGTETAVA